ncbi:hypothetical protein [Pectobacterium brasiliense]|uniref:hypothetical protein n=1 Tax=Pectobacterium brasiliense TaxID=180957 RepID=UPI0019690D0D|nr:hypothetical protein [Pectobacterium brasiliense]MBN3171182.1 hypothetical protein [Pectobacterium brasiliense]
MTDLLSKERLETIAALETSVDSDGTVIAINAYGAAKSIEIKQMAQELLQRREEVEKPVLWEVTDPVDGSYITEHEPKETDALFQSVVGRFYAAPPLTSAERERLAAYDRAAKEPVAWISDRNLKALGRQYSVHVKHEPVMVHPVALFTAPPLPVLQPPAPTDRIVPVLPVRDEYGFWRHPNRIETPFDEGGASTRIYEAWFAERGMAVDFTYMNQVFCDDCVYGENIERPALHWNPESPYGDGWLLTAIFDTEEGPCAEWVRYKSSDSDKEAG